MGNGDNACNLLNLGLPQNAVWHGLGVGPAQFPIAAAAVLAGGHVSRLRSRCLSGKERTAKSNASLVRKAVEIVRVLDREIASPGEARMILGLGQP